MTSINVGEVASPGSNLAASVVFNKNNKALYSTLAPPPNILLPNFDSATLYVYGYGGATGNAAVITGKITSLTQAVLDPLPAPEPSTTALLLVGGAAVVWRSRKRLRASASR